MLSDEEKKAIKGLEWSQQQMRLGNLPDYDQGHYADIRIILNLIEKQSKEIEELKEDNKHQWEERCKLTFELENSTSNDKIKAKIEELEKQDRENRMSSNYLVIPVLQSLLEKE